MNKILHINACVRECSRTKELTNHLLARLEGDIETIELCKADICPLDGKLLSERDRLLKEGQTDNKLFCFAKQFAAADTIVISAPYWDLMFPAILKVYLENITVGGITFRYSEKGIPQSLCKAKKLCYVTTSGGFIGENNFGFDYLKALATGFFGISDVRFFSAQGLDIYGADITEIMNQAAAAIDEDINISK